MATVVVIRSLSYTGTTWLNTILGCHEKAMALGPADRIWNLAEGRGSGPACRVHGDQCDFWPEFLAQYKRGDNFFVQLEKYSGKSVFVTNNPIADGVSTQLRHPDIETKYIHVIRDGRAIAASRKRRSPDSSFLDIVAGYLQPSFRQFEFDEANPDYLCLRYEDVLADQEGHLKTVGKFVGIDYEPRALRFWEWKLHLTSGNQGTMALMRLGQGLPITKFESHEFYEQEFAKLSSGSPYSFRDDRAAKSLTKFDRFLFDCVAGADNARFGYERDRFTFDEFKEFSQVIRHAVKSDLVASSLVERLDPALWQGQSLGELVRMKWRRQVLPMVRRATKPKYWVKATGLSRLFKKSRAREEKVVSSAVQEMTADHP